MVKLSHHFRNGLICTLIHYFYNDQDQFSFYFLYAQLSFILSPLKHISFMASLTLCKISFLLLLLHAQYSDLLLLINMHHLPSRSFFCCSVWVFSNTTRHGMVLYYILKNGIYGQCSFLLLLAFTFFFSFPVQHTPRTHTIFSS